MLLKRLGLAFSICFIVLSSQQSSVQATTSPTASLHLGDDINLDGTQFVKVGDNLLMMAGTYTCPAGKNLAGSWVKCITCPAGSSWNTATKTCECLAGTYDLDTNSCLQCPVGQTYSSTLKACFEPVNCDNPTAYFDTWQGCASLAEFETACLVDSRNSRAYRVRAFADGQCWMVDSLRFGGHSLQQDGCAANNGEGNFTDSWCGGSEVSGCTTGGARNATKAQEQFSPGFYGHCRQNNVDGNYLYDWVAVMQNTLAYNGSYYNEYSHPWNGICPPNWHVPSSSVGGEYATLINNYGSVATNFWLDANKFNGALVGGARSYQGDGELIEIGDSSFYWTSAYHNTLHTRYLRLSSTGVFPYTNAKDNGYSLRCVQDLPAYDTTNCANPVGYMTTWDGCAALAEHETVCLSDPRDYRTYRVRKLADGNCWMVDSLKFGGNYGDTDGCSANSGAGNFSNGGSQNAIMAQETFATGYYGHCRAITAADSADGNAYNNYLYDWVAALQSTLAYYGSSTTFTPPQQGICPTGWHLPSGNTSGEYGTLVSAYNNSSTDILDASKGNFALSGDAYYSSGSLIHQGIYGLYWSSTAYDSNGAYNLWVTSGGVGVGNGGDYKADGFAVRCIKN
ncbi:hypothetical protein IJJ27_02930 [bacterium]|nr:hypothetical protein [bacterium]MBQ6436490.1 hypothetical protein [bacterium]